MTNKEWLKDQCNRYAHGFCQTLACVRRGGLRGGDSLNEEKLREISTCHAHEILNRVSALEAATETASKVFRNYAELHAAKNTDEGRAKAELNNLQADGLDRILESAK